jgi:hypothetical protein
MFVGGSNGAAAVMQVLSDLGLSSEIMDIHYRNLTQWLAKKVNILVRSRAVAVAVWLLKRMAMTRSRSWKRMRSPLRRRCVHARALVCARVAVSSPRCCRAHAV